jgi:hypothetical protein
VDLIKLLEDNDFASLLGLIWKKCMPFAINYYDDCVSCRNILLASSTNIYIEAYQDLLQLMELCRDVSSYSDMRIFFILFPPASLT